MEELLSDIGTWLSSARSWLHGHEPDFVSGLPLVVRVVIVWFLGVLAVGLPLVPLIAVGGGLSSVTMFAARSIAIRAGGPSLGSMARLVVSIESVTGRWGLLMREPLHGGVGTFVQLFEEASFMTPREREHWYLFPRRYSRALGWPFAFVGLVARVVLFAFEGVARFVGGLMREALKPSVGSAAGWLAVLWYFEWFDDVVSWFQSWDLPQVSLSQVVAGLTILVVLYIAMGADIRGRAEINKHASFEARKHLLSTREALDNAADSIRVLRHGAQEHLDRFPNSRWLIDFTGNPDVVWGVSMVVHHSRFDTYPRIPDRIVEQLKHLLPTGRFDDSDVEKYREQQRTRQQSYEHKREREVLQVSDADDILQAAANDMIAAGLIDKVPRVLPYHFAYMWFDVVERRLQLDKLISLPMAGTTDWITHHLDAEVLEEIARCWTIVSDYGGSYPYRIEVAARLTGRVLRTAVKDAYIELWWLAITEHRLRAVERNLASMLAPSFLGRLHQAIGK